MSTDRRYDIDWLRVIAIGLLLIYHIGIAFQPWGVFIGFIQNQQTLEGIWPSMALLNVWRIPLLFFVSGMGVCFAIRKRSWKQLLLERTRRIFVPFLFGVIFIVPLHILLWQKYYNQDLKFSPGSGHLWFLANIFIYVLLLTPVFFYLKKRENGSFIRWIRALFSNPLGLLVIAGCFVLESVLVKPEIFSLYALTLHGFLLGMLAFFFGFCFVLSGDAFWNTVRKWRWLLLSIAALMFVIRLSIFDLEAPSWYTPIESCSWIFAVLGFANKYLNRSGHILSYLSKAAYPVYILHMIFLYLPSYFLFPLEIPVIVKFISVILITGIGSFASYELIRRVSFLRPLFGLK